jgi:DNA-binding LacI/PurR family transcriptional regulator
MPAPAAHAVRLIDVARAAGVSRVAAAHVLNGAGNGSVRVAPATRERVERIARELNYRPNRAAQQLRGVPSGLIGVIFDSQWPTNFQRLSLLEQAGIARGLRFMVGQVHGDPRLVAQYLDDFQSRGVQGILCVVDLHRRYYDEMRPLFAGRRDVIFHGRPLVEESSCVRVDTADGIRQAVSHLLDRGRQRIGLLLSSSGDQYMQFRRDGYEAEHVARGLAVEPALVWCAEAETGIPDQAALDRAVDLLVRDAQADAIIAADDVWAVRLIQRLKARGVRVPDDVAVVGYDNLDLATVIEPALTTIDQQHESYAREAIDLLLNLGHSPATTATVKPKLIVREST